MVIKEVHSQEIPSDDWPYAVSGGQPSAVGHVSSQETDLRSQRINKEACHCLFPLRSTADTFGQWSKRQLKASEHIAEEERDMERLAGRWTKLRHAFNDWLDEIFAKKNADRLERAKGFEFEAKVIEDQDPFDRLLAHLLCHGESINEMEELIESNRNYRSIRWSCLQPKPPGTDQAAA